MSLTNPDGRPPSLSLAPLPDLEPGEPLFPVDPQHVVADPPSLQGGLLAAALLWCTHSMWPTVRAIAACAGISPSSVLWPYGTADAMRHALVHAERTALARLVEEHGGDILAAAGARSAELAGYDPRLSTLPLVAALAAGVHDADELAALAAQVRQVPAA